MCSSMNPPVMTSQRARPRLDLLHAQAHEPVRDEHVLPGLEDRAEHGGRDRQVSVACVVLAGDDDVVARTNDHGLVEVADPHLRALEVGDQGERSPGRLLRCPDEPGALAVIVVRSVREVEPRSVHPGRDQPREHVLTGRGGPDRADDLRSPGRRCHRAQASAWPRQRFARGKAAQPGTRPGSELLLDAKKLVQHGGNRFPVSPLLQHQPVSAVLAEKHPSPGTRPGSELLLDAQKLVVLRDAVRPRRCSRLDLAGVHGHSQVGDRRVLGLAGPV